MNESYIGKLEIIDIGVLSYNLIIGGIIGDDMN